MKITILGCGTSVGVPAIGCTCATCQSTDPHNKRLRASVHIQIGAVSLLIDTSPDLRQQALRAGFTRVDAVLYTHAHADHTLGLDDLRIFNFLQQAAIPMYGSPRTLDDLKKTFWYCFADDKYPGSKPALALHAREPNPFAVLGISVVPIPLFQANLPIYAYRIGNFCYVTDCSRVPEESWSLFQGVETLIVNALRPEPHPTHFSLGQALEFIERIGPRRAVLTHMNHELEYQTLRQKLLSHIQPAYDGLVLEMADPG